jgi:RNA polymerase sigma-70 factor (ECF subfamily)
MLMANTASAIIDDDQCFLRYARTGDSALLEPLLLAHLNRAYGLAYRMLGSAADADDAVQEAYLQLVRTASRYDGTVVFAAWLGRLVHLACLRVRRSQHQRHERQHQAALQLAVSQADQQVRNHPEDAGNRDAENLHRAIVQLPARLRVAIELHYFAGLSQEQVGVALGLSSNAVGVRIHRGRERLRRAISPGALGALAAPAAAAPPTTTLLANQVHLLVAAARDGTLPESHLTSVRFQHPARFVTRSRLVLMAIVALIASALMVASHPDRTAIPAISPATPAHAPPLPTEDAPAMTAPSLATPLSPHLRWQTTVVGCTYVGQPVFAGGLVLIPTQDAAYQPIICAFDPATGAERWRRGKVFASLSKQLIGDLLIGNVEHGLEAIDTRTGTSRWRLELKPQYPGIDTSDALNDDGDVVVMGDEIYFMDRQNTKIIAVDVRTAALRWTAPLLQAKPQTYHLMRLGDMLVCRILDNLQPFKLAFLGVSRATGAQLWQHTYGSAPDAVAKEPVAAWVDTETDDQGHGRLIALDLQGRMLRCMDSSCVVTRPDDRDHVFPAPPPAKPGFVQLNANGSLATLLVLPSGWQMMRDATQDRELACVPAGSIDLAMNANGVTALEPSGRERWSTPCLVTQNGWSIDGGVVWCGTQQGEIVGINLKNGSELERQNLNAMPEAMQAPKVLCERAGERWSCIGETVCAVHQSQVCVLTMSGWVLMFTMEPTL